MKKKIKMIKRKQIKKKKIKENRMESVKFSPKKGKIAMALAGHHSFPFPRDKANCP